MTGYIMWMENLHLNIRKENIQLLEYECSEECLF